MPKGYRKDGQVGGGRGAGKRKKPGNPAGGRGKAKNPYGISPRHLQVVDAYEKINFSSQKDALLACGYSEATARNGAHTIFLRPDVQEELEKRREKRRRKLEVTEDMLVQRLRWLVQANPGEIIQKLQESDYDLSVLTEEEKYAVSELAQVDIRTGGGQNATTTVRTKVKIESALTAIDKLMRKMGLYKDKVEVTAPGMSIVELLEQGRQRIAPKPDTKSGENGNANGAK